MFDVSSLLTETEYDNKERFWCLISPSLHLFIMCKYTPLALL